MHNSFVLAFVAASSFLPNQADAKNRYQRIADSIFERLESGTYKGTHENGETCSLEIGTASEESRPDFRFSYSHSNRFARHLGDESISGAKFSGTLGNTLMSNSGAFWTTTHHIITDRDNGEITGFQVDAGLSKIVRCTFDN